jgi:hypothetical protein
MNHQQPAGVSRRSIVKGGVYALTGISIASLTRTGISAAETKLAKSAVQEELRGLHSVHSWQDTQGHGNLQDSRGRDQSTWPLHSIHAQAKK